MAPVALVLRHRARRADAVGVPLGRRVYSLTAVLLFGIERGLPPLQLEPEDRGAAQAPRPLEHLPHHRGQLHAVRRGAAAAGAGAHAADPRVDRRARSACCSACSGWAPRAGSTRRSTSRSAGSPSSTSRVLGGGRPGGRDPARGRRTLLLRGRRRLRAQAAQPVADAGSASTRSSTRSRSQGSSRSTSPCLGALLHALSASYDEGPRTGRCRGPSSRGRSAGRAGRAHPLDLAPSPTAARPASRRCSCPTSFTHQASASARDRATPASTRVSSTSALRLTQPRHHRHGQVREQHAARRRPARPTRPCGRCGARSRGRSRCAGRGCPRGTP